MYKAKTGIKKERIGPVGQKILLILLAGASLSLTRRPDHYFRILKSAAKEWRKINQRTLKKAIYRLYQSQMIDYKEDKNGLITLVLSEKGKKRILKFDLDKMEIKKSSRWDGFWRIVAFDIPEYKNKARKALVSKMKELGFYPMQKSVFVYPYDCKNEINFILEIFEVKPYVRYIIAKDIDITMDLKQRFKLS
ncbi:hypothetical protein A2567_00625 [Candidatus Azambacteria bacterium RIFOXYD1_FULL_42_11]|uniref:Transcriptional regulator, PaaX family n=3 Tax=Candidatus Azamiibacteriota TaxID=1752741 RepID=A0A0G1BIK8_9BACT|nr:MAG: Transcriptional regulator, PaaX family [Candidatus Azambacteria bacterium GW2011_GWA1_42_19]KKS88290.1 MAG: Transcriptional regulator, PaaX family [Parcubacteria group bacterium GW2011_GWC1_43_11]OGD41884.1 MAG: hypothetical protein A2567_00625 [Candidatus Azambacteria bacterium RIFOXYD1_FULL_42_11]